MKEELILYKQAKEAREISKKIVLDLLSVNLRRDKMSKAFLQMLEQKADQLIARSYALKQTIRQLAIELEKDPKKIDH